MLRSQPSRSSKRAASQDLDDHSDSGHSSSSHSKAGRQKRRRLTIEETEYLISVFENTTQKPNAELRQELADKLNMTPRSIQIWFQVCSFLQMSDGSMLCKDSNLPFPTVNSTVTLCSRLRV
ncbi:hypothetical protein BKA69DRAFT_854235 [Paraphysoderma sedebokerense]|nr:hypothetical protein BKA69DRAFT_854235 [Paraphysoderma sedebokerense]